jgi:hypothetical protein
MTIISTKLTLIFITTITKTKKTHSSFSSINKSIHDYISRIFKYENVKSNYGKQLPNFNDFALVEFKSKYSSAIEYSGVSPSSSADEPSPSSDTNNIASSSFRNDATDQFLAALNIKINLIIMICSITMLTFYSYFLNIDDESDSHGQSGDNNDDGEKKKMALENDVNEAYIKLKQKKCHNQIDFNLLWIIHSLFIIYVLSIWDISDVYHYFKVEIFFL